jgi:Ca2+:H+ antiporter
MSLVVPAALSASLTSSEASSKGTILVLSRGTAIILLLLYILYLFFQLKTHSALFDEEENLQIDDDEGEEPRVLKPIPAAVALLLITTMVAVCADYLVDSIDDVVASTNLSRTFIGLILLPIVGNAAEHVTACIVAAKGKMDLAIGVALGSSLQIALFVTPAMVILGKYKLHDSSLLSLTILGWIIHQPMTLHFHSFETVVFFVSMLVVNYLIIDGRSNYLEGAMCLGT